MTDMERRGRATEAFFGRRKGKALREQQADRLATLLPAFIIDLSAAPPEPLKDIFAVPVDKMRLEIGFGGGEHLIHRALETPSTGFIGVEPFVNSMQKLLARVDETGARNVRVYNDDATQLLDWLPDHCLDQIDLLYPDPWPKRKHWKRRFVSKTNLDRFHRVLKPGGLFCFASDIDTYVNWTLLHCRAHGALAWQAGDAADWHRPYEGWPGTRYEAKAIREGRRPAYLTFVRS